MKKLALLLSLLALGALGLVACGEGDDEDTTTAAKVSADTTTEAKLSREQVQQLRRVATKWASLFAAGAPADAGPCTPIMGQPLCMRLDCRRCLAAYRKTFADATVEDIALKGFKLTGPPHFTSYRAAVRFSNGEVVMFGGAQACGGKNQPRHCHEPGVGRPIGADKLEWGIGWPNRRFLRALRAATTQP